MCLPILPFHANSIAEKIVIAEPRPNKQHPSLVGGFNLIKRSIISYQSSSQRMVCFGLLKQFYKITQPSIPPVPLVGAPVSAHADRHLRPFLVQVCPLQSLPCPGRGNSAGVTCTCHQLPQTPLWLVVSTREKYESVGIFLSN